MALRLLECEALIIPSYKVPTNPYKDNAPNPRAPPLVLVPYTFNSGTLYNGVLVGGSS